MYLVSVEVFEKENRRSTKCKHLGSDSLHTYTSFDCVKKKKKKFVCGLQEIAASRQLQISTVGSILSIAFFNFFGISVTKKLSGAGRAAIDACRTLLIWMFSLAIGWEKFLVLQVSSKLIHMSAFRGIAA